jgi:6-phosphogluconolactonase
MLANRRLCSILFSALFCVMAGLPGRAADNKPQSGSKYLVYFGTYTGPKSKGIYAYRFDPAAGKLDPVGLAAEIVRPSWVTVHPNHKFLYAVSELGNNGKEQGSISSFAIDAATGELKFLNKVSSGGGGACHLAIDKTGKTLYVANYGSGSVAAFPLGADGTLGERSGFSQHEGSSVNPRRQKGPHAHAVVLSADNRFLFVPDLGTDKVMSYRIDPAEGSLTANDPPFVQVKAGSGPRHFTFAPNGKFAYLINEMGSRVTAFSYNPSKGSLEEIQTTSTLPQDFRGENNSAEIEIDRRGRFLYATNRGDDSIAVFAVAPKTGKLTEVERVPTQGKTPRNIKLDPTGKYLFAANQDSNNVVIFKVDNSTGRLTPTGQVLDVGSPVCVQFVPLGKM